MAAFDIHFLFQIVFCIIINCKIIFTIKNESDQIYYNDVIINELEFKVKTDETRNSRRSEYSISKNTNMTMNEINLNHHTNEWFSFMESPNLGHLGHSDIKTLKSKVIRKKESEDTEDTNQEPIEPITESKNQSKDSSNVTETTPEPNDNDMDATKSTTRKDVKTTGSDTFPTFMERPDEIKWFDLFLLIILDIFSISVLVVIELYFNRKKVSIKVFSKYVTRKKKTPFTRK